jgi:hypothetical protein
MLRAQRILEISGKDFTEAKLVRQKHEEKPRACMPDSSWNRNSVGITPLF